jgi:hypothetical protein
MVQKYLKSPRCTGYESKERVGINGQKIRRAIAEHSRSELGAANLKGDELIARRLAKHVFRSTKDEGQRH